MITVEEARRLLARHPLRPAQVEVPLARALGCVLAQPVKADRPIPPFDRAAVDGYAVRLFEPWREGAEFLLLGTVQAGQSFAGTLRKGTAVKVMTGAPVPAGADGVVMVEKSELVAPDRVRVCGAFAGLSGESPLGGSASRGRGALLGRGARPGIASKGSDSPTGKVLVPRGTRLEAQQIALLASVGAATVLVYRRPTVSLITTGAELVDPAETPGPSRIRDSNAPCLQALLDRARFPLLRRSRALQDRIAPLRRAIRGHQDCDLLLVTGGVSMGDFDLVPAALIEEGYRIVFHKVAMKPGKPLLFGTKNIREGGRPRRHAVLALPGNPVSVLVSATEFVLPYLRAAAGWKDSGPSRLPALVQDTIRRQVGLSHFVLGHVQVGGDGRLEVVEVLSHGSGDLVSAATANCLIPLSEDDPVVTAGSTTWVHLLEGSWENFRRTAKHLEES